MEYDDYPLPAFYFQVLFDGNVMGDTSFMEVSGIESRLETVQYAELSENRFVHTLPTRGAHGNLVLKRGVAPLFSPLVLWCKRVLEEYEIPITTKTILVNLLNADSLPVRTWVFSDAYPVKWNVGSFESKKNELAIETIEFAYTHNKRFI